LLAHFSQSIELQAKRRKIMGNQKLIQRIAQLESINDQLVAELEFLDNISRKLGFQEGLKTLKSAAEELLEEQQEEDPPMAS
jgi:hypothetical protein